MEKRFKNRTILALVLLPVFLLAQIDYTNLKVRHLSEDYDATDGTVWNPGTGTSVCQL